MYRKGEVRYEPLPLPDRVQREPADSLAAALAFRDYMKKRHSVREYDPAKPVSEEVIAACVAAAGTAPSGASEPLRPTTPPVGVIGVSIG